MLSARLQGGRDEGISDSWSTSICRHIQYRVIPIVNIVCAGTQSRGHTDGRTDFNISIQIQILLYLDRKCYIPRRFIDVLNLYIWVYLVSVGVGL